MKPQKYALKEHERVIAYLFVFLFCVFIFFLFLEVVDNNLQIDALESQLPQEEEWCFEEVTNTTIVKCGFYVGEVKNMDKFFDLEKCEIIRQKCSEESP